MCGLTLVITKAKNGFSQNQCQIFGTLLYLSGGFRGRDGAGITVVDNAGNVKIAKAAMSVDQIQDTKEYHELDTLAWNKGWAMIGHNRSATRGSVTDANAHPFIIDDKIVLVHNGTFIGDHKKIKETEVDSEAIGHALLESKDAEEALRKINAAYALIWYNVENKSIHVIRNGQRPLWFMETDTEYIFSSEEIYLQFCITKFSIKPTIGPFEIKVHSMSTFLLKDNKEQEVECTDLDCDFWKHNKGEANQSAFPFGGHAYRNGWDEDSFYGMM